ncbi:MAG: flagellar protein FlaG [bacterium]|nr:flagellar protein FlaG [bacterium]
MDSASNIGNTASRPVAVNQTLNDRASPEKIPVERVAPENAPVETGTSAAVVVDTSTSAKDSKASQAEERLNKQETEVPKTREEAEKAAKKLEQTINRTAVQFRVAVEDGESGGSDVRFKVVDIETGKVVRQFPPNELPSMMERASKVDRASGNLFIDNSV